MQFPCDELKNNTQLPVPGTMLVTSWTDLPLQMDVSIVLAKERYMFKLRKSWGAKKFIVVRCLDNSGERYHLPPFEKEHHFPKISLWGDIRLEVLW